MDALFGGRYQIDKTIGSGGLSTVYSATDTLLERRVAIKVSKFPDHATGKDLFRSESLLLAKMTHPAVTKFYDVGALPDGSPYMVMELLDGQSLDAILRARGSLPLREALFIGRQVAGALGEAHALGYIHRDVKPANILVLNENSLVPGAVKLLDFGVAEQLNRETAMTRAGSFIGSVSYMSPQQIRAEAISPSSDIWSLGVTLFEMLTGSLPFKSTETFELMTAIMNAEISVPPEAHIFRPVVAFLMRCLAKDPALRPADGNEALKQLEELEDLVRSGALTVPATLPAPSGSANIPEALKVTVITARELFERAQAKSTPWFIPGSILAALALSLLIPLKSLRLSAPSHLAVSAWYGIAFGVCLVALGMLLGRYHAKTPSCCGATVVSHEAQDLLSNARGHERLSRDPGDPSGRDRRQVPFGR